MTRARILEAIARLAPEVKGRIGLGAFTKLTGITGHQVRRRFPRGWHSALEAAGFGERVLHLAPQTDEQLLASFDGVVRRLGRLPRWKELARARGRSQSVYANRFRSMKKLVAHWREWSAGRGEPVPGTRARPARGDPERTYGTLLACSALGHAPLNEAGVIHAFGVLGEALGFVVVRVRGRFPDCEALRRVSGATDQWQRVRIEFEYRSSNFERHGHDAHGCDLIVCWEHDWPQCPVEVVELRKEVGRLRGDEKLRAG